MLLQIRTLSNLTDDADAICVAQTKTGAGYLTLDGVAVSTSYETNGVAVLGGAQIVRIISAGDDSGVTFTVTGKNENHNTISEDVTGANINTALTTKYFETVDSIYASGTTDGDVQVGAVSQADSILSSTICPNTRAQDFSIGMSVDITGTMTVSVQQTVDNVFDSSVTPVWSNTVGLTGITSSNVGNIAFPVTGVRLLITSYTSGSATLNLLQAG